jgi:predicted nucleotidyltransferase
LSATSLHAVADGVRGAQLPTGVEAVYLFGSARHGDPEPPDLDLLIVYASGLERQAMRQIGEPVREALRDRFHIPLHLLLLSPEEVRQTGFVEFEDAVQVWP